MGRLKDKIAVIRVKNTLGKLSHTHQGFAFHVNNSDYEKEGPETDSVLITKRCTYIITINNYQGSINGKQNEPNWYQTKKYRNNNNNNVKGLHFKSKIENTQFLNPVLHNMERIKKIKESFPTLDNLVFYNLVVFPKNTDIGNVAVNKHGVLVIKHRELKSIIDEVEARAAISITKDSLMELKRQIMHTYNNSSLFLTTNLKNAKRDSK